MKLDSKRYEIAGISDVGLVKKVNEDSLLYKVAHKGDGLAALCVVADGVGNLQCGEVASSIAVKEFSKWWEEIFMNHCDDYEYLKKTLYDSIYLASSKILDLRTSKNIRSASTLALLFLYDNKCQIYSVGDSRVYQVKKGAFRYKMQQLTEDHSCEIDKEINNTIVKKSVLTEYLGKIDNLSVFSKEIKVGTEDVFIVCSDGIYKTMKEQEIKEIIVQNKDDMKMLCNSLILKVRDNMEKDNISVIAIKVCE